MRHPISFVIKICATAALFTVAGCGSGGGGSQSAAVTTPSTPSASENSYSLTADTYGLQSATFMSATNSNGSLIMRAAIAESMSDPGFRTVFRIDVVQPQLISGPGTYDIGGVGDPVEILFFNGRQSTLLNTLSGTITFTSFGVNSGDLVEGSFAAVVEDQNSVTVPRPTYTVNGNFRFVVNSSGALNPDANPVPVAATGYYNAKCANCHSLGNLDYTYAGNAPDLSLKGGEVSDLFTANVPGHNGITLSEEEIHDLKILLNAN